MPTWYQNDVVMREISLKAKFLIYQLNQPVAPTLNYGHVLWVMTEEEWGHRQKRPKLVSFAGLLG